jgi:hypothetical protein
MKHKVFFWLVLKDRVNTRDLLRRKGRDLESYTCDMCILHRLESSTHLFLRNFAKAYLSSIGVTFVGDSPEGPLKTTRGILLKTCKKPK